MLHTVVVRSAKVSGTRLPFTERDVDLKPATHEPF